ncbi:MAG: DNA-binding transcriptional regulator OxyR [Lysobacterales bacterium]|jgi:LysR family hydrogen peroxide-inducible transcriptional activator|nr:MAG: DNA-binding transcriptional regulator OxyR [Xanthomonadales bacterium]
MNLRDLRYLVALADEKHFGKAAERCFVSQPTLSAQIRKLEEYLGVPLVERQPKRVALTETGVRIVERARRLLQEADAIVDLAKTDRDPLSGPLKVGLIPTVGPYLLPHVATRLRRDLPRLKLMLYEHQTAPLLEKLRAGELDVGILALPVPADGLETAELYDEPFALAVPAGHPLAEREHVRIEDLRGETVLLLEDGHCLRDQALEVCSRVRVQEPQDYRATSLETLRQMVAAGHGITLLPDLAAESPVGAARGLRILPFGKPAPARTIGAVWRKSTTRGAAIEAVAEVIRGQMHEEEQG